MTELEPLPHNLPEQYDADRVISAATAQRISDAIPESTKRAYRRDRMAFIAWCQEQGRTPLPCTPETLAEYANHLASLPKPKAPKTIQRALSAIRTMHAEQGHPRPELLAATKVLAAHQAARAEVGQRVKKAAPVLIDDIRKMVDTCPPDIPAGVRDRALIVLGWAMMARRSELAALRISEITETRDGIEVWVRRSKTDQAANGVSVAIPYGTHPDTCPVRLLRAWLALLAAKDITEGPLWCSIDRHGNLAGTPKFAGRATTPALTGKAVGIILRRAALRAHLPNLADISAHSLRAGGASGARRGGADMIEIARHGRWADGSKALLGYIRDVDKWRDNPMRGSGL